MQTDRQNVDKIIKSTERYANDQLYRTDLSKIKKYSNICAVAHTLFISYKENLTALIVI